ncbi:hypothetical protein CYMTET_56990 [Cymbomonas tetramitiformis]|uniref:EGF-like domain-containing protein n=1 Tax=Cymbomonas tetramitiformis TaxID=36881 RepID=A0AAE0BB81_9CHLO|nr:hypothetical protein CYMTET_56990 [Cymbomonas tetramitiformis]
MSRLGSRGRNGSFLAPPTLRALLLLHTLQFQISLPVFVAAYREDRWSLSGDVLERTGARQLFAAAGDAKMTRCSCTTGRFGERCEKSLANTVAYFPRKAELAACNDPQERTLATSFHKLQHPGWCRGTRGGPLRVTTTARESLASWTSAGCGAGTFACYLQPFSDCSPINATAARILAKTDRVSPMIRTEQRRSWPDLLPNQFRDKGLFWYHSRLAQLMWQVAPSRMPAVEAIARRVKTPCIAIQVRRGDACKDVKKLRSGTFGVGAEVWEERKGNK